MFGRNNDPLPPTGAALDSSIDLRAQRGTNSNVPHVGPTYGPFTSGQDVNPPLKGGDVAGLTAHELQAVRSVMDPEQFKALIAALARRGNIAQIPFNVDVNGSIGNSNMPQLPRQESRYYLFIQNRSTVNSLLLGFDQVPSSGNAMEISANLGAYEPWAVPVNSISLVAAAGTVAGTILVMY